MTKVLAARSPGDRPRLHPQGAGAGGDTFVAGVAARLRTLGLERPSLRAGVPVKDLNDLHRTAGSGFAAQLKAAKDRAMPLLAAGGPVDPSFRGFVTGRGRIRCRATSPRAAFRHRPHDARRPRPWIADIADRAQCPPDFLGIATLVAIGAVVGRTLAIRPKRHDDWTVVPNLWGIAIGRPGVMKTPALEEALRPLHRLVLDARKDHEQRLADHAFTLAEAQARLEVAKKKLKKAVAKGLPTEALRDAFTAPLPPAPTERRYLVNDATVEKLGELLNQNPNGLLALP